VIIYPSLVQGASAAQSVVTQIQLANARNECDLLIVGRGGGSLEDLWCFNEEIVAYAIYNSQLPIISAVGHEIDVTIADFVADLRAATPSAAAELVSQNKAFHEIQLQTLLNRLKQAMFARIQLASHQHALLNEKLLKQDPKHKLQQQSLQLDELSLRLQYVMQQMLSNKKHKQQQLQAKLSHYSPAQTVNLALQKQSQLNTRLQNAISHKLKADELHLQNQITQLNAISPLATLARGYAIVKDKKGKIKTDATSLNVGEEISVRLAKGEIKAQVL
jgi:exodeoxyribonuclease VII large subunit